MIPSKFSQQSVNTKFIRLEIYDLLLKESIWKKENTEHWAETGIFFYLEKQSYIK